MSKNPKKTAPFITLSFADWQEINGSIRAIREATRLISDKFFDRSSENLEKIGGEISRRMDGEKLK